MGAGREMTSSTSITSLLFAMCLVAPFFHLSSAAQQVTTTAPLQTVGSGFSESMGVQSSFGGRGWFWNNNNLASAPFGPPLVNQGASGGFRFGGNGLSGNVGFQFAQGSDRSIVSSAPSITTMNGQPGSFFSGEVRPFVMGVTPVVGSYPTGNSELAVAAAASQRAMLSAIVQGNAERQNEKLRSYLLRAERAEAAGDVKKARANYKLAASIASDPVKSAIHRLLQERFSAAAIRAGK